MRFCIVSKTTYSALVAEQYTVNVNNTDENLSRNNKWLLPEHLHRKNNPKFLFDFIRNASTDECIGYVIVNE
jgi:hypothetical protein